MQDFECEIVIDGRARWAVRFAPGMPIQLPSDLLAELAKRPTFCTLTIDPREVSDDAIRSMIVEARRHLSDALTTLRRW